MHNIKLHFKRLIFVFQGFLFAVFTMLVITCLFSRFSILNSNFHKKLFLKHNVCFYTYNYIYNTIGSFSDNSHDTDSFENNLIKTIRSSISLKFVSLNLESIRNGMFKYFNGEKEFLPDVYFSNIDNIDKLTKNIPSSNFRPLKKVNLSTILGALNLNHVLNDLFLIKFIFFVIRNIPVYISILALFVLFVNLLFIKDTRLLYLLAKYYLIFVLIFSTIFSIFLIIAPINTINIPNLDIKLNNIIINYINDLFKPISIMFVVTSILTLLILLNLKKITKGISFISSDNTIFHSKILYATLSLVVLVCVSYKLNLLKNSIKSNNFDNIIWPCKDVLSVEDKTIYAIQVIVLDSKTKMPIPGIAVSMTGISCDGTYFNNMSRTNASGNIFFKTSKGDFYIDFVSDLFPPEYILPKRLQINFESAKTIAIPVHLKYINSSYDDFGIINVTMLDSSNMPYPNIELCFISKDNPDDRVYSIANSCGIATFRGRPGIYTVSTSKNKFPLNYYNIPNNFDVSLENGTKQNYIIKLVKK